MRENTAHLSVGSQSPYGRPCYVEAALIIAIILIQLRKNQAEHRSLCSQSGSPCAQNNAAMSGAQRGNITDVYLSPPRQLPAFMPLPCLSRIVQTNCFYLLCPQSTVAPVLSGPTESNADTWSAGLFFIYTNICYFQACILHCSGVLSCCQWQLSIWRGLGLPAGSPAAAGSNFSSQEDLCALQAAATWCLLELVAS